jgi:hypothetical protein
MIAEIQDGRLVSVRGDKDNPLFRGYVCVKGRTMPEFLYDPRRLLQSLRRTPKGFEPVPIDVAMDEVAQRLQTLVAEHGPRSVATYYGTQMQNVPAGPVMRAFAQAIGTSMNFGASTVDKPGRPIAWAVLGKWQAPPQGFADPDVVMMLGINPFVNGLGGLPAGHPGMWLADRLRAGMELIVIDPRRSDIAKRASIFLQPRPGYDIPILAAMLNVILSEGLHDAAFTDEHVRNLDGLRRAVAAFPPGEVTERAGLGPGEIEQTARVFARAGRGYAVAGTGPHFAGHGTLLEYLALCLDTVCGHWMREGELVPNVGVLAAPRTPRAQAADPRDAYGFGERSRIRGLGMSAAGMPSATLAEEILLDGPGRVRALLSCGGNPVAALPDQVQTVEALERLDLLVQIDPWISQTARYADFVIAPTMTPEMIGTTLKIETSSGGYATGYGFPSDYAQYCDAVVDPPAGSEVIEDWRFFYGVAQRMGLELTVTTQGGERVPLDMVDPPESADLVDLLSRGSHVPLDEIKKHQSGAFFPTDPPVRVRPKEPGWTGRLDVGPRAVADRSGRPRRGGAGDRRRAVPVPAAQPTYGARRQLLLQRPGRHRAPRPQPRVPLRGRPGRAGNRRGRGDRDRVAARHDPRGGRCRRRAAARDGVDELRFRRRHVERRSRADGRQQRRAAAQHPRRLRRVLGPAAGERAAGADRGRGGRVASPHQGSLTPTEIVTTAFGRFGAGLCRLLVRPRNEQQPPLVLRPRHVHVQMTSASARRAISSLPMPSSSPRTHSLSSP